MEKSDSEQRLDKLEQDLSHIAQMLQDLSIELMKKKDEKMDQTRKDKGKAVMTEEEDVPQLPPYHPTPHATTSKPYEPELQPITTQTRLPSEGPSNPMPYTMNFQAIDPYQFLL